MDLLSNIKLFIEVAKKSSFSEVARTNNISAASVTRQINFLEKHLNTRLLQRSTRSVSLTDSGKNYFLKISKVIEEIEEINNTLINNQDKPVGTINLSCPSSFSLKYIIPHIADFNNSYPDLKINFYLNDNLVNLIEDEIDIVIRIGALKDSSMIIHPLTSNKRVLCCSDEYISKYGKPLDIEDLHNHKCLIFKNKPIWYFSKDNKIIELQPDSIMSTNSGSALKLLTSSGIGISVLSLWLIKKELEENKLEILFPEYMVNTSIEMESDIYILYPNKKYVPLKIRLFIDFIKKCMAIHNL